MTSEQIIVLSTLGLALLLFAWGRWRYDIVALIGWRLLPRSSRKYEGEETFDVADYIT